MTWTTYFKDSVTKITATVVFIALLFTYKILLESTSDKPYVVLGIVMSNSMLPIYYSVTVIVQGSHIFAIVGTDKLQADRITTIIFKFNIN